MWQILAVYAIKLIWLWLVSFGLWRGIKSEVEGKYQIDLLVKLMLWGWMLGKLAGWSIAHLSGQPLAWWQARLDIYGVLLGVYWVVYRYQKRKRLVWSGLVLDQVALALPWLASVWLVLDYWLANQGRISNWPQLASLLAGWVLLGAALWWLKKHYRRFDWYHSGKVGLVFASSLWLIGWFRIAWLVYQPQPGYWWWIGLPLSAAVVALASWWIYHLSGRDWSKDKQNLTRLWPIS